MAVVSEVVKQHDLWAYPYNALRNQALSRAATEVRPSSAPLRGTFLHPPDAKVKPRQYCDSAAENDTGFSSREDRVQQQRLCLGAGIAWRGAG